MDEPTNDLDLETLELLEELLSEFAGTLLLVSHDRAFLDNVITSCLVFEDQGRIREYVGGYSDWLRQRPAPEPVVAAKPRLEPKPAADKPPKPAASGKLGYNERRELERLPARIEELEQRQRELHAATADPAFYKQESAVVTQRLEELRTLEAELEAAYGRWEALEARER
jgi:ATP-binding cassette subfamily F protein uup